MKITLKSLFAIFSIFILTGSFIFAEESNIISQNETNLTKNIESDSNTQEIKIENAIDEKINKNENQQNTSNNKKTKKKKKEKINKENIDNEKQTEQNNIIENDLNLEKNNIITGEEKNIEKIEITKEIEKIDIKPIKKEIKEIEKTNLNTDNDILQNSLLILSKRGKINLLKQILKENHLYINWQNEYGMTALLEATKANQEKMIKFLIKLDAEPKIASKNNITNLRFAVENNNKQLVKLFLKYGLEVGSQDINGQSPLLSSIENNFYDITKILLDNIQNFDVDLQDKSGRTLLMVATENNDVKLVKKLISKNANVWLVNNKNEYALSIAEKHSNKNLIKILKNQMEKDKKKQQK